MSGLANLLMYLFNTPPYIVENLYPKGMNLVPIIPHLNTIITIIFVTLLIICQFGGRLYIYLKSNQNDSSNELLSSSTLAIALAVRIGSNLLSKLVELPQSVDKAIFQFGIMIFIPSVILLNHKSTREYFARKHPRLAKSIKVNPVNPGEVHQDQVEEDTSQEPTSISIEIHGGSSIRARHQNIPFQTRVVEMPRVE